MRTTFFIYVFYLITALIVTNSCTHDDHAGENDVYYQCPMHPQVISDEPGTCPICGMELVKRVKTKGSDTTKTTARENDIEEFVMLTARGYKLANVATVNATTEQIYKEVRAFGYIDFYEPGRRMISAKFSGRIEKLYVNATGQTVGIGTALFDVYSPDLAQAQNEYLIAQRVYRTIESSSLSSDELNRSKSIVTSARNKLLIMGMTENQVGKLDKDGNAVPVFTYYSPFAGTVLEKRVQEGMYINEGSALYDLAELSTLWNIAEVYADDAAMIRIGSAAIITAQNLPGEGFTGRVSFIYPTVNESSRTISVRTAVANRGGRLKPGMYTESRFSINLGTGVVVPEEAVLFTGRRNIVWVVVDENTFAPREVIVGVKFDGKYQITAGLAAGERIASSGAYLIDSESRLRAGTQSEGGNGGGASDEGAHTGH